MTDTGTRGRGDAEKERRFGKNTELVIPHSALMRQANDGEQRRTIRTPHSSGFTLLEVMVAVAILSLVLVSLIGLKNRSAQDVLLAEHMTTATLLAKQKMTEALLAPALLPEEKEGEFEDEAFKGYLWKKVVAPTQIPAVTEVRIAVLWKEGERDEMVELVSYE